jgi:hypothetical protein
MLATIKRWHHRPPNTNMMADAPWFEIWLFKTHLRFRLPSSTMPKRKEALYPGFSNPDLRPFVNTESLRGYSRQEELGYYARTIYRGGWWLYPDSLLAKANTELQFDLMVYAVSDGNRLTYPNVMKEEGARCWIEHHYHARQHFYSQFYLQKDDNGTLEIINQPGTTTPIFAPEVESLQINNQTLYRVQTEPNQLSYWLAFSPCDFIRFDFTLEPLQGQEKLASLSRANDMTQSIISTITLTPPSNQNYLSPNSTTHQQ